jgi:DNA-binding GntR family transcriptional regulator
VIEAPPLSERAYAAIRELIVSLELPPGAVINERALIERLGIGRTPVREALRRLAHERLVEIHPRRGMFVTSVEVRDLSALCEVRLALEPIAARLAARRATVSEREELDDLVRALDRPGEAPRALMALDERIHRAIYRCAHNPFLEATLEQYYVLALRIWYVALDRTRELGGAVQEHQELLLAIGDGDAPTASRLMREHVQNFEDAMRRVLLTL